MGGDHEPKKTIGNLAAYVICINYVVGTGVFGLPYGFYSSGIVLATVCLIVSGIFSLFCAYWVLEVLARTEGIQSAVYDTAIEPSLMRKSAKYSSQGETGETSGNVQFPDDKGPVHQVTFRKFDFTRMFHIYYGLKGKIVCQIFIAFYCYGVLWAYVAVFATEVSNLFFQFAFHKECSIYDHPSTACNITYYSCIAIYTLIVIPLTCLDVAEQAALQVILASYRLLAFIIMIITVGIGLFNNNPFADQNNTNVTMSLFNDLSTQNAVFDAVTLESKSSATLHPAFDTLVNWGGFSSIFSTSVVALTFHYNIPDIIVTVRDKSAFKKLITGAVATIVSIYWLFGFVCAVYFGSSTKPLVTLNWQNYTGLGGGWGGSVDHRPWWAAMIQLLVMLFPILDMLSVFPLVGITLGNNILETTPLSLKAKVKERTAKYICRFIAAIPPIILGAGLGNLEKIFGFCALFAFFLEFVFPCFLQFSSVRLCRKWWGEGSEKTPYSGHLSHMPYVVITLIFGSFSFLFAFVAFVKPSFIDHIFK